MARSSGGSFRGGSRGNSGRGYGSSRGRSTGGKQNTSRNSVPKSAPQRGPQSGPSGGRSAGRKGATAKNVVTYSLYDSRGKRTYVGSTNNPERRATEHRAAGKLQRGGSLVVESPRMSRAAAQRLETKKLNGYRSRTGRLPKGNKTPDGQFRLF